jgi:predicted transposase/invertase (TIGR01784 family)
VQLKDQDGDVFYDKLHFKFLQMPLFTKTEQELTSRFDKWCYFLKNLENFEQIPTILKEPLFEKAFHTSEIGAMTREDYNVYQESLLSYWESKGMIDTARDEGKAEGIAEGEQIGENKKAIDVAKKAIGMGMTDEQISLLTGLSVSEIRELRVD